MESCRLLLHFLTHSQMMCSFNTHRERETETDRQTNGDRDRQTETARQRASETETARQRDRERERYQRDRDRGTDRQTDRIVFGSLGDKNQLSVSICPMSRI